MGSGAKSLIPLAAGAAAGFFTGGAAAPLAYSLTKSAMGTDAPKPNTPTPLAMPTPNDPAIEAERKRKIAEAIARSGRTSTILTDPSNSGDTLGG